MTREQAKEMLPIIQAFADGKTIQYRLYEEDNGWKDIGNPAFNDFPSEYRIKPEPKYRPFQTKEECWSEMHKHPDFGWVKYKATGAYDIISSIYNATIMGATILSIDDFEYTLCESFNNFCFTDGTPFGIKEE